MNEQDRPWVLITGACGGIGKALVEKFLDNGYRIIATDIQDKPNFEVSDLVNYISLDLSSLVSNKACSDRFATDVRVLLKEQGLKALVNNAALQILGSTKDVARSDWARTLDVNLTAPFLLVQSLLEELASAEGSVVNIASVHSKATKPGFVAYATSKAALVGLTHALAVDLGSKIRVNAINPAATETQMLLDGFDGKINLYQELEKVHPLNRIAKPEEIARVAIFLASDQASFITGSAIDVDGGILNRLHDID